MVLIKILFFVCFYFPEPVKISFLIKEAEMINGIITSKWKDAIAPLVLGTAFIAANKQFKLVDLSDPWVGCTVCSVCCTGT